jgi:hypothetical protein
LCLTATMPGFAQLDSRGCRPVILVLRDSHLDGR